MSAPWPEIEDSSEEIFDLDIPELREYDENVSDDETWNAFLNSNWDF
jgi:hypothetical protein